MQRYDIFSNIPNILIIILRLSVIFLYIRYAAQNAQISTISVISATSSLPSSDCVVPSAIMWTHPIAVTHPILPLHPISALSHDAHICPIRCPNNIYNHIPIRVNRIESEMYPNQSGIEPCNREPSNQITDGRGISMIKQTNQRLCEPINDELTQSTD